MLKFMSQIENYVGHMIRRLHQHATAVFADEMTVAEIDITPMQYAALAEIAAGKGKDQARLAEIVACDRATMGGIIERLEIKGLIERKVHPRDRRARVPVLTKEGQALLNQATLVVHSMQPKIVAGLEEDERAQLHALIVKAVSTNN